MQAIVQRETGAPDVLRLEEVADPTPGPGEVVVRLRAASVNRLDVWVRLGLYPGMQLPLTPGVDGAGVIAALGAGVEHVRIDQEVVIDPSLGWGTDPRLPAPGFGMLGLHAPGTYAQFVRVPAINVHAKPARLSWEEAAALPMAGLAAYRALVTRGQVQAGETVLIPGIGGGVAGSLLQLAQHFGANALVTSGSEEKLARAKALGASAAFNYRSPHRVTDVQAFTGGRGTDLIVDGVGGETFNHLLAAVRPGGRIVSYGATSGPTASIEIQHIFWKQIDIRGTSMGGPEEFAAMLAVFEEGNLQPVVDQVFPLAEAGAAQQRMLGAAQFGKIILSIPGAS